MHSFSSIGHAKSNFVEKFGIPRQPGLSPSSEAKIVLPNTTFNEQAQDLDGSELLHMGDICLRQAQKNPRQTKNSSTSLR